MGIFDDYGIDPDSIKDSGFGIPDGTYLYEVSEAENQDGSTNHPNNVFHIITFQLENENGESEGEYKNWTTLKNADEDGDELPLTKGHQYGLSLLKGHLKNLGIKPAELESYNGSQIIGKTGTLSFKTTKRNGKENQNMTIVSVDEGSGPQPKKAAAKAPAKAAPARRAKPAPVEDDDENPFG